MRLVVSRHWGDGPKGTWDSGSGRSGVVVVIQTHDPITKNV